jgi:hypothetical protein
MQRTDHIRWKALVTAAALAVLTAGVSAQEPKTPEMSADQLLRETVENEVAIANHPQPLHMFRSRKQTPRGSQTKLYVETDDAIAAMLIAVNDRPLDPPQQQAENGHLDWLINNADALRKKHAREKEDVDRTLRIVKALPEAFHYEYDGTSTGAAGLGRAGDPLVKLTFSPNPAYTPPSRLEQVLAGMQGYVLIDTGARRIAKIDGTLFRDVSFGWGLIGRLNKGGHVTVQQSDLGLGDGEWGITEMTLNVSGRILLFKGLNMVSDEVLSDFRRVPDHLTFSQGVKLLEAEHQKLAHNRQP